MKILHITPRYHPAVGGCETFSKEISERLASRGHEVMVLAMADASGHSPTTEIVNSVMLKRHLPAGRLHDIVKLSLRVPGVEPLTRLLAGRDALKAYSSSGSGLSPFYSSLMSESDVVTVINWYDPWVPYQVTLARSLGRFSFVGIPLFHTETTWSRAPHHAELLRRCDSVITLTAHEAAFVQQRDPGATPWIAGAGVDRNFASSADGARIRARYGLGDAPVVGYVGRLVAYKGTGMLIKAMQLVWRSEPTARAVLAGSGFPSEPDDPLRRIVAELSDVERSRVTLIHEFEETDKASIFDALDVFAMPSAAESFGIAYLEAWCCRKPVIGLRSGAIECVIDDGMDGLLVPADSPEALAEAILRLLENRAMRDAFGATGHSKTMARYTWDRITDRIETVYRHLPQRRQKAVA
jgi:glycosyltransferase involved in cell wall biosynthesis